MEKNKNNFKQIICTIIMILVMIILLYVLQRNTNSIDIGELPTEEIIKSEELQIYFFNVGQADSILVRNDGKNMLIDAGDNEDGPLLAEYIKQLGISRIDYLIGTHVHKDHLGGMDNIIKEFEIGNIYIPYTTNKLQRVFYEEVISEIKQKNLKIDYQEKGNIYLWQMQKMM